MYQLPVKIEYLEQRKRSIGLLHVVAGFFLIANAGAYYKHLNYETIVPVLPVYFIAALSLIYGFWRKKIDPQSRFNHWLRLLQFFVFLLLGFLFIPFGGFSVFALFIWAFLALFLLITERRLLNDSGLQLNKEGIRIPGLLKQYLLPWQLIENITIRPDFITIFRTNKKYVQLEVLKNIEPEERRNVEQFCKQQIEANTPYMSKS